MKKQNKNYRFILPKTKKEWKLFKNELNKLPKNEDKIIDC